MSVVVGGGGVVSQCLWIKRSAVCLRQFVTDLSVRAEQRCRVTPREYKRDLTLRLPFFFLFFFFV